MLSIVLLQLEKKTAVGAIANFLSVKRTKEPIVLIKLQDQSRDL